MLRMVAMVTRILYWKFGGGIKVLAVWQSVVAAAKCLQCQFWLGLTIVNILYV